MTKFRRLIERSVDRGVTERRPVPGVAYKAFVVHPRGPGPITLAVAHYDLGADRPYVLDLIRDGLTIEQASHLMKAYGINTVTGADDEGDNGDSLAHAVAGVFGLLKQEYEAAA